MKTKLTPFAKLLIIAVVLGVVGFLAYTYKDKIFPAGTDTNSNTNNVNTEGKKVIKIGVVTWGGYAGGQYFNEGFNANENSRFYKEYGFFVEFKVLDDFVASRNAWKTGDVDLLWATIDAFTTEVKGLEQFEPQVILQADWSRGGDAIVVNRGINSVKDLKGKQVAFAEMTPSHTFLLWLLEAGNLKYTDIIPVKVANAIDAADLFKKGKVDAAVVWSPDDADCVQKVSGAKILQSTKSASHIIADIFIAKKTFVDNNKTELQNLLRGWFKGAAEINTSEEAKIKASKILAQGLNMPEEFCKDAINNVRLCNYGDNISFFGLNTSYTGITGEEIYNKMETKYRNTGYIDGTIQSWRTISNPSILTSISELASVSGQEPEGQKAFTQVTEDVKTSEAIATKNVSINFPSGSFTIDENMKTIIDLQFLDIAKSFANSRIRIEGNTDNTGSREANIELSRKRAQAVADYLINEHRFDRNRFVIIGNGPDKPVASNNTNDGKSQNRRTDFELISK
jgi:NitT/TauT family transport system substrate-binding protein